MGYRPSLDGLRAIAVLAVMCWHFVLPGVKGGFLGVDIFFVLSSQRERRVHVAPRDGASAYE